MKERDPRSSAETEPQIAPADAASPGRARLLVIAGHDVRVVPFPPGGVLSVGRSETADVQVDDLALSRVHVTFEVTTRECRMRDEGSSNGTFLRGERIAVRASVLVPPGEPVSAGGARLMVLRGGAEPEVPEVPRPARPASGERKVVVADPAMVEIYRFLDQIAPGEINVLFLGETGVGKEILVEELHRRSKRAKGPLLRLNCGALSESLLESELFGHERGAFTGAVKAKPGLLESAQGGTIFLDEVGEMPLATQAKLLRVMEERKVRRVGGLEAKSIDVRFASATNRDLEQAAEQGSFRSDLFYRLNGVSVTIPPLRERRAEIEALARAFTSEAAARNGRASTPEIAPEALSLLAHYRWPGNIRELRNVIERAVLISRDRIGLEHLPVEKLSSKVVSGGASRVASLAEPPTIPGAARPAPASADTDEKRRILEALEACGGNQTRAAKQLGISRKVLMARLDSYGIPRPKKRDA